ncbi:hypothetical protein BDZ91DRAFT_767226 [Kalaharituber pfeilii]|nr:hypothetical protein BDZ91DRAFT_767226 [Kalaharituber pfeilii]
MTPRPSVDGKLECASPKEKSTGFRSFLLRLGGKRSSLPQLQNLEVNYANSAAEVSSYILSPTKSISSSSPRQPIDAPPLFEAYPQAIKAAALAALTTSSDTILRRNMEQRAKKGKLSQRVRAYSRGDMEWTQKMFLLVPSMILQYSGDGAADRTPEKILQLTSTSVAFASDAIPGRPYVLQVSQSANPDGSPIMDDSKENRKGILLKLPWKSSSKHIASSFLLVFDTAKEMDSWMGCIRVETAKIAGTFVPEKEEVTEQRVPRVLSRRITIRREEDDLFDTENTSRFSRYSKNSRASLDAGTSFTTAVSSEQATLDRLRGSRSYLSLNSNGRGTVQETSPETSPERNPSQAEKSRRSSLIPLSTAWSRSSTEFRSAGFTIPRNSTEQTSPISQFRAPSPCSGSAFYGTVRVPIQSPVVKVHASSPKSTKRNSGYSTLSMESNTPTKSSVRRSSVKYAKPDFSVNQRTTQQSSSLGRRSRPASMVNSRRSLDAPRYTTSLPRSANLTPVSRNLQRRSMTSLGSRPDYGIGPPSFPPPQIPLPELPPEGYDALQSRRKSLLQQQQQQQQQGRERRLLRNSSSQTLAPNEPTLGSRHSFHGVRSREKF